MNEQHCISLELAEKLVEGGCELGAEHYWQNGKLHQVQADGIRMIKSISKHVVVFPAYDILNDICVMYWKEFFKETSLFGNPRPSVITSMVFRTFQEGDKKKAEEIIWKHCLYNYDNEI